tara:strand:+ start:326 stop:736 length:411 start_codon:yes stop_codon:yes gene_type:complete
MLKKNPRDRKNFDFLLIILLMLIIFSNRANIAYGADQNWLEVSKTSTGIQYFDRDSLIKKDHGIIQIKTKYSKIDTNTLEKYEENIYTMKINCISSKYKDISINGKYNSNIKWEKPNRDKLINDVISYTCKNAKDY